MCMTPNGPIDGLVCMGKRMQPIGLVCMDLGSWQQVNLCAWQQPWTWVHGYNQVTNKSCMVKSRLPYLHGDKSENMGSLHSYKRGLHGLRGTSMGTICKEVTAEVKKFPF